MSDRSGSKTDDAVDRGDVATPPADADAAPKAAARPRRSRRRRKPGGAADPPPSAASADVGADGAATQTAATPEEAVDAAKSPGATAAEDGADDAAPRRRRRGTRGGRRARARRQREKGGTGDTAVEHEAEDTSTGAAGPTATPQVPPSADAGPEPPSSRRRRSRRKRTAKGDADEAAAAVAGTSATPAAAAPSAKRPTAAKRPTPAADEETVTGRPPDAGPPAEGGRRGGRRRDRRPQAIVREGADVVVEGGVRRELPPVELPERKLILVTDQRHELRVAIVEDGRLAEIYFERPGKPSMLGDIYQGKVENVIAGMDAAFIDFGLDKNGFLYVDEVRNEDLERKGRRRISSLLKNGQQVLVQVIKDPMGSKGARLSMKLSLAGRYLVYVPGGSGVGVSRRLRQSERERLRDVCKELKARSAGLIVRTAAEGKGKEELRRDLQFLSRLWSRLKKKAATVKPPGQVYSEVNVALEVVRDLFNETVESVLVDDEKRYKEIVTYLTKVAPELVHKVRLHTGDEPLFEAYGIEEQIARTLERRVPLPSGGNLMIDHAEALTVIDVNTGRFTSGRNLEETILKTNTEAAREVVRQLRLRDIGGIIIIDFIDMAHARSREAVLARLEAELETDRTKTYVVELSPLGLVEMTRQNTTDGARGILTRTCPTCLGKARVLSEETVALGAERRLRAHARKSGAKAVLVEVNSGVAERLEADGRLKRLEKDLKRRIFLEGSQSLPMDSFRIVAEGSLAGVQEQRIPVREGQEVELELEFALTYSPRDAVGYVEGYMVVVEGGRQHLGAKRAVKITTTARTGASATLASGGRGRKGR